VFWHPNTTAWSTLSRGRKLVAKWFEELSHGGLVAVLFDVGALFVTAQSAVFTPPACVCAGSPGERKLRTQDSVNASISRPGGLHWLLFWDINAIQFALSVFNSGTKEMLRNGLTWSMLPKKGEGLKHYPPYSVYTILTCQKGIHAEYFLGPTIHPRYIGEDARGRFFLVFLNAQTTPI
jgi:hypothetical protein